MSRKARLKHSEAIYHIICRSITEVPLFRNDQDKCNYLKLLKRYIDKFNCVVYAYCLMDNHLHLHFDPKSFDVSKFMHCLNTAYVQYYNGKYKRRGPLFQDRFVSRIVDSDRYNLTLSAYIHNNPKDLPGYEGREEYYPFSSYGFYLGVSNDTYNIINKTFIAGLFGFNAANSTFRQRYHDLVNNLRSSNNYENIEDDFSIAVENEYINGRTVLLRDICATKAVAFISQKFSIHDICSKAMKGNRKLMEYRSICAYILRVFCGLNYKEICSLMNNITISGCSRLCDKGYALLNEKHARYSSLYKELVNYAAA